MAKDENKAAGTEAQPTDSDAPAQKLPSGPTDVWRKPSANNAPFRRSYIDSKTSKRLLMEFHPGVPVHLTAEQVKAVLPDIVVKDSPLAFYDPAAIAAVKVSEVVATPVS